MEKYSINKKLKTGISIAVFTIALVLYISINQLQKIRSTTLMLNHTEQVIQQIQSIVLISLDNEIGSKGYVISGKEAFLEPVLNSEKNFKKNLVNLKALVSDNPNQLKWLDSLQFYFNKRIEFTNMLIGLCKQNKREKAVAAVSTLKGKYFTDKIRAVGAEMTSIENTLLTERKRHNEEASNKLNVLLLTVLLVAFILSVVFFLLIQFDIKNQRKLQERLTYLANMVEQSSEAIFSRGKDMKIISWNKGAENLFGYTKEEAMGKSVAELNFTALSAEEIETNKRQILANGTWTSERYFYHRNGSSFYSVVSSNCIRDENGEAVAFYFIVKDISHIKRQEEELRMYNEQLEEKVRERTAEILKREVRFRTLLENGNDIITMFNQHFQVIYRSPSAEKVIGWTEQEVSLKVNTENVHPDDKIVAEQSIQDAKNNPGKPISISFRIKHKEGHFIWIEGVLVNLLELPEVGAIVFNFRDITERKSAEEKLIKSEEHFRMLFDQGPDGIFISDHEGNYQDVNNIGCDMLGYTFEELTSMNIADILVKEEVPLIPQAISNLDGGITSVVWTILRKDGSTFLGETTGRVLPDGRLQGIVRDVTQKIANEKSVVASEKQFRNLLDTMLEGAQLIGFDWRYLYVNDAFTLHAKYTREELLGKTVMEKFPGIEKQPIYIVYQKCFDERVAIHMINEFVFPDQSIGYFELSFQPVPEGIFILSVDITEKRRAEIQLQKLNTELEVKVEQRTAQLKKANDEMSAFTYSVSHDLRAPLRGIIGFTDILVEDYADKLDNEAKRLTSVIKHNAVNMAQLIDDLLTFSRMGKQEMVKVPVDIQVLVNEIIATILQLDSKHEKIVWNIKKLPLIKVDVSTIRQVWINVISNAIKYSGKKEQPVIEIGSWTDHRGIGFYIKDNGVGFDEAYKHKLFKVFQRLHSSDEFEGTGVGLAVVEKIVSRYDGIVWAEGNVNEGACFYFLLPKE